MRTLRTSLAAAALIGAAPALAAAQVTPEQLLRGFQPSIPGVEYETPATKEAIDACKVESVKDKNDKAIGFALRDGQGKVLRRFVDSDGKVTQRAGEKEARTHLDQWSYYQDGFEVYREVDANDDGSLDECRWMNGGGTRVAVVRPARTPDGKTQAKIVGWKRLSAEEASKVLVQALIAGDADLLGSVLATPEELESIGAPKGLVQQAAQAAAGRAAQVKALTGELKGWGKTTAWSRFDGAMPHVIPADAAPGLKDDIILYENAVVFAAPPAGAGSPADIGKMAYLHILELVKVGDAWKLVELPLAVDPTNPKLPENLAANGLRSAVYRVEPGGGPTSTGSIPPELLAELSDYDKRSTPAPDAGKKDWVQYHVGRMAVLRKIIAASKTPDDQLLYYKQVVHDLAEAYRTDLYPEGAGVFDRLIAQGGKLASFAAYRRILAEFDIESDNPGSKNFFEIQAAYLKKLEKFLADYAKSDEEPEALYQLATVNEFNNEEDKAKPFYARLARDYAATEPGKKAAGALRRLELDGKPFKVAGVDAAGRKVALDDYRGRTVLVVFWSSQTEQDKRELADLAAIYGKNREKKFEVLGVNLDADKAVLAEFLKGSTLPWANLWDDGGLENGQLANEYGIISTPTMILVDAQGRVMNRKIRKASEVERILEKPLAGGSAGVNVGANK